MNSQLTAKKVRSRLLAMSVGAGVALAAIVIALAMWGSTRLPELDFDRFESALQLWREKQPSSYHITVEVTGRQPGTYKVKVTDGVVEYALLDGRPLRNRRTLGTWAVHGMFETMRLDLTNNEKNGHLLLRAEFDPGLGIPQQYERIEVRTGAHDALHWEVIHFETTEDF